MNEGRSLLRLYDPESVIQNEVKELVEADDGETSRYFAGAQYDRLGARDSF